VKKKKLFKEVSREDMAKGGKFLVILVIVYALLSFGVNLIVPLEFIELIVAKGVSLLLGVMGIRSEIILGEPIKIILSASTVQISYLCTGLMELFILVAAVVATTGIEWKKKLIGVIGAGITAFAFNLFRITVTILVLSSFSLETAELTHDLLFRISLFAVIVGYYFVWYYFSTK